jgi:hypothetical protein
MTERPDDIVGHKTFGTGRHDPATGLPETRHEPLTRAEADAMWESAKAAEQARAERMPDEQSAIRGLMDAWLRLKEIGWRDGMYTPRDGTHFQTIEVGSTGIFDCVCSGEWPRCTWTTFDDIDAYPSSHPPALFKLYPADQAKYDARMAEARARYQAGREADLPITAGVRTGRVPGADGTET